MLVGPIDVVPVGPGGIVDVPLPVVDCDEPVVDVMLPCVTLVPVPPVVLVALVESLVLVTALPVVPLVVTPPVEPGVLDGTGVPIDVEPIIVNDVMSLDDVDVKVMSPVDVKVMSPDDVKVMSPDDVDVVPLLVVPTPTPIAPEPHAVPASTRAGTTMLELAA